VARVLITGGAGFIGAALTGALAARGDEVAVFDQRESPALVALRARHPGIVFHPGELTEWPHLMRAVAAHRPELIVHCAAIVGVVNGRAAPLATMRVNVEGSLAVLEAMRLFDVPRLVNLSSEEVYGAFEADIIDETHPCRPVQTYGISKYAVERLAGDFAAETGAEVQHVRTCWVYGPDLPRPRIPKTFLDAAIEGRPLHVPAGAEYVVDQVHIDDLVEGMVRLIDHRDHRHDVYHLTTGAAVSLGEMVGMIREIVPGADISIGPGPLEVLPGLPAVRKGALDCSRARAAFGYAPALDLRRGLAACVAARQGMTRPATDT